MKPDTHNRSQMKPEPYAPHIYRLPNNISAVLAIQNLMRCLLWPQLALSVHPCCVPILYTINKPCYISCFF